jgi:histidinol-phosphate aminotransferase
VVAVSSVHGDRLVAGLVDYAVNVRRTRPRALSSVLEAVLADTRYPDEAAACEAIAARHGLPTNRVLPLNGACEAFWLLAATVQPERATVFDPTFSEGEAAVRAWGATIERIALCPPTWSLEEAPEPTTRFVVVTNPNNPTGRLEAGGTLRGLLRPGRLLVVDESFIDFGGESESLADAVGEGVVVVRSLTKILAIPGLRAGYLLAAADLVERLRALRQPWPVNTLALAALRWAAEETAAVAALAAEARREREDLTRRLRALAGVQLAASRTNFLLVRTPRPGLWRELRARGYAVRPPTGFRGLDETYFRVAARDPEDNARFAAALGAALGDD